MSDKVKEIKNPPFNKEKLVEVYSSNDTSQTHYALALLENEGISAIIDHETLHDTLTGYISVPMSIMIREQDMEQALQILQEADLIPRSDHDTKTDTWHSPIGFRGMSLAKQLFIIAAIIVAMLIAVALYTFIIG